MQTAEIRSQIAAAVHRRRAHVILVTELARGGGRFRVSVYRTACPHVGDGVLVDDPVVIDWHVDHPAGAVVLGKH